jgi:hypothetical protein
MFDYEIVGYEVEYCRNPAEPTFSINFDTEEDAYNYITRHRHQWVYFNLIQTRQAIIF